MNTISRIELEAWQENDHRFALIAVLPNGLHPDRHLLDEDATHEFLEKVSKLGIGNEHPIVLYETGSAGIESAAAVEVLLREGFQKVYCFTGPQSAFYDTQHGDWH